MVLPLAPIPTLLLGLVLLYSSYKLLSGFIFRSQTPRALDDIPGPESESFLRGSMGKVFGDDAWEFHKDLLARYGGVVRLTGFFGRTQLLVSDPKALHHIVVKEQHIYEETPNFIAVNSFTFGPGLLSTLGDQHRRQRKMLNPVFSIAHMREMVPIFYNVVHKVRESITKKVRSQAQGRLEIDIVPWLSRTALELIGQSGFGYSFDSLAEDSIPHPYAVSVKKHGTVVAKLTLMHIGPAWLLTFGPKWFRRFLVDHAPFKAVQEMREIVDMMYATSVEILEGKKRALEEGDEMMERRVERGKDVLSILLRENMRADEGDRLEEEEVIGQMSTLTFAAMDTTSSALSRILYLLAEHQDVQDRLRAEIREARERKGEEEFGYDDLEGLVYLDAICRETLRLYPPVSKLNRKTREATVMPVSKPVRTVSGRMVTEVAIPKGTVVGISIIGSNHNPEIWGEDSYEWKPERWLKPLREEVGQAKIPGVYSNLMTFLGGGRACIGFKFAQLEIKVFLTCMMEGLRVRPSDKEVKWRMRGMTQAIVDGKMQLPLDVDIVA